MKHTAGFAFVVLTFTNPNRLRQINIRLATNAVRFDHIPIMRCAPGAFAKLNLMFHHVEHCLTRWKDIDYPACLIWTIACFNYCITYIHFRHEKLFFSFGLSELSIWTKKTDEGEANWSISAIFALLSWTISTNWGDKYKNPKRIRIFCIMLHRFVQNTSIYFCIILELFTSSSVSGSLPFER